MNDSVLIIAPHPDDEVLGCSTFLEGATVLYVTTLHPDFPDGRNQKEVNVVGFAYRDWAWNILHHCGQQPGVDMAIFRKPEKVTLENIQRYNPDIVLFYGWSWKVPSEIIKRYLCLCLHPSPLPKYRGGSPLQHQILNGEAMSAISIFRMIDEIDAGDLCSQVLFPLL